MPTLVGSWRNRWHANSNKCGGLFLRGVIESFITGKIVHAFIERTLGKTGVQWGLKSILADGAKEVGEEGEAGGILRSIIARKVATRAAEGAGEVAGETLAEGVVEDGAVSLAAEAAALEGSTTEVGVLFGPEAMAVATAIDIIINIAVMISIAETVMFGIENAGGELLMEGVMCNINESTFELIDNPCSNGYIDDDGKCQPCKQINNMKDLNYNFESNYDENFHTIYTKDPVYTGKLSKLLCRDPKIDKTTYSVRPFPTAACINWANSGEDHDFNSDDPVQAFPEGNIDTNTFLLSSGLSHCTETVPGYDGQSWDKDFDDWDNAPSITTPITTPNHSTLFPRQLSFLQAPPGTEGQCASPVGIHKFACWWADGRMSALSTDVTEKWETVREDLHVDDQAPYEPMTFSHWDSNKPKQRSAGRDDQRTGIDLDPNPLNMNYTNQSQHLSNYDDPNVCNHSNLELAGATYQDMISPPSDHTLSVNKKMENINVSNHCCPKIVGAPRCPFYNYEDKLLNITSSPADFMDRVGNATNDYTTDNCYIYDTQHPEFLPEEYYNKFRSPKNPEITKSYFNRSIKELRRAGIQCGPGDRQIALGKGSIDGETIDVPFNRLDGSGSSSDLVTVIDVMRPDGVDISPGSDLENNVNNERNNYYGTRLKLRNNYSYDINEDSGATGYENYLDPENYIYLPCNQNNTCGDKVSKFFETDWGANDKAFYEINSDTTINDVIARENGHPDRMKPLCDNYICNDLEKTKYMQTVYDGLCSDYTLIKGSPAPLDTGLSVGMFPLKNKYKKFYRPAGISNYDEITVSGDKEYYSDICCDPVPFSNKWSFVGCDANGKNPYFIDQIIQDYNNSNEPTLPSEDNPFTRERINPQLGEKQNLNQCIPSMETKCTVKNEYLNALVSSRSSPASQEYFDQKERCESVMDNYYIRNMLNKDTELNTNIIEFCESKGCDPFFPNLSSDTDLYGSSPNRMGAPYIFSYNTNDYWHRDPNNGDKFRYPEGYVPTKGYLDSGPTWANNWTNKAAAPHNSVLLNQPTDNYTECNAIPPELRINDIEIYDKRIDWDKNTSKLRFSSDTPPPPHEELFKIYCKYYPYPSGDNSNMNNILSSPTYTMEGGAYYYNVSCSPSPQPYVWEEITTRERVNTINLTYN
jgi:hypothetical protein